jgi:error-prone DNA polymerase
MMHPYMRRRQKKEAVTYPHPSLEPVLKRTLGVPLFQEQLLRIAMTVANFSGAEAEELRRAVGMRRSWERMKSLETQLRAGMTANGLDQKTQDTIVENISSFALYGFPESHAASFALIAYASAYFKVKYLAAFTCAILNNQPMGFYSPAVLVKDAQRHGLRVKPIDVQLSAWPCTIEHEPGGSLSLRMGLGYAKGLRKHAADMLVTSRSQDGIFCSAEDLARRVPSLNRKELSLLAKIGALNKLNAIEHRRDALWQVEHRQGVLSAQELRRCKDGEFVRAAGCVIARQRPGTAKGFIFLSMEDETGISNVIVTPDCYERNRVTVTRSKFLLVEGILQNQDSVIHIKATRLVVLSDGALDLHSHDFH